MTNVEGEGTACLNCAATYKIEEQKFVSQKCGHHFCEDCITTWRTGWELDKTLKYRQRENDEDILTKKCLQNDCNVHHDRLGGGKDSRGAEQSCVEDKRTMCNLLIESIQLDDKYKIHLQAEQEAKKSRKTKLKERHRRSLT